MGSENVKLAIVAVVVMVVCWTQTSRQDSRLQDVNRELLATTDELKRQTSSSATTSRQDAPAASSVLIPPLRAGALTLLDVGTQMQEEGKHEAVIFGPNSADQALTIIKTWTMCQQLHVDHPQAEYTTAAATERWKGKLLERSATDEHRTHTNLDLVWVNVDPAPKFPYHHAMAILRNWVQKARVGSVVIVTDVASKDSDKDLLNLVKNQLARELAFPAPAKLKLDDGTTVMAWRMARTYY